MLRRRRTTHLFHLNHLRNFRTPLKRNMSFSSLPLELKEKILDLLDNESLLMMQQVSEDWNTSKIQKKVDICLAEKIEEEYQRSLSIVGLGKHQGQDYLLHLDTTLDKWVPLSRIPSDLKVKLDGWSPHLHVHGDKIYLVGVLHCHVAVFETKTGQWRNLQADEDTTPRWGYATAMMGHKLFCFGGQDENGRTLDTVHVLDTEEDVKGWETVCSMSTAKMSCGVVEHGGKFYIFGGQTEDMEEDHSNHLASAEVFDPECNQWEEIPKMAQARSMPSVSVVGGKIVVACGFDHEGWVQSAESFDPETQTWDTLPDMTHLSGKVNSVAHNGVLHVKNGNLPWAEEDIMERFDGREWEEVLVTDCRISSMCLVRKEYISVLKSRPSVPGTWRLVMAGVLAALTGLSLGAISWWNSY